MSHDHQNGEFHGAPHAAKDERSAGLHARHAALGEHAQQEKHAGTDERAAHDKHASHSVAMFRDRFWISLLLTIPTLVWEPMIHEGEILKSNIFQRNDGLAAF